MSKEEKYILVSLEDEKSKKIAESISNKTARKILDYLSSKEDAGAEEISKALKIPLPTVDYNLKNLKKSGLIEAKQFVWSQKGKRVILYKIAKKLIIIAPKFSDIKKELKNIIPLVGITAVISVIIQYLTRPQTLFQGTKSVTESTLAESSLAFEASRAAPTVIQQAPAYGLYFFLGALFIITIYFLIKIIRQKD
ncbi:helix-turn-helix transcriptional regulator [Candidatus Woesearchaeota archaeon]|nr:helix-turn-helix transcriptional regulator [Candidatus Woesearchaeota archaeon]